MQNKALLLILGSVLILSCKTNSSAPSEQSATIVGHVILAQDADHNPLPMPYSGVEVSIEGSPFSTTTDDSGRYEFKNVPEGSYNVSFVKQGYGTIRWFGKVVEGGSAPQYWYEQPLSYHYVVFPTLYKCSDLCATVDSVSFTAMNLSGQWSQYQLVGHYSGPNGMQMYSRYFVVYYSHKSNVSASVGKYDWFDAFDLGTGSTVDTVSHIFRVPVDQGHFKQFGFQSGDSIYFAVYGAPRWSGYPYADYYDPNYNQNVLTSINQTRSPVLGLKIP